MLLLERAMYRSLDQIVQSELRFIRAVKLLPFGWEYWDVDTLDLAVRLWMRLYWTAGKGDELPDGYFSTWLGAHIGAFEDYWWQQPKWSGPLKRNQMRSRQWSNDDFEMPL